MVDRLFAEQTSAIEVRLDDEPEPVTLEVALSRLMSPERDVRRHAAERVTEALQPGLRTRAYIFNTLLASDALDDTVHGGPKLWIVAVTVLSVVAAVVGYDFIHRMEQGLTYGFLLLFGILTMGVHGPPLFAVSYLP